MQNQACGMHFSDPPTYALPMIMYAFVLDNVCFYLGLWYQKKCLNDAIKITN